MINDWGVLDWVTEHHPTSTPVLGRLMNKMIRDPRMPDSLRNSPDQAMIHKFQTCNLAGGEMKGLLDQYQAPFTGKLLPAFLSLKTKIA